MKKIHFTRKGTLILLAAVLAVGVVVLEKTDRIDLFGNSQPSDKSQSTGQNTKGEPDGSTNTETSEIPQNNDKQSDDPTTSVTLKEPSGTFVSNHKPNLDGEPAPNVIQSTCVTTPGAKCIISFARNGDTVSLRSQTTDKEGVTYWTWKLQDIGLSEGIWTISATATLGSQTKTTKDAIPLEVGP